MLRDSRDIIRRLKESGFELVSVRGSHHKFRHRLTGGIVIVPHPATRYSSRNGPLDLRPGWLAEGLIMAESHYIALIHKEPDSGYGVSFPDIPGVIAVAETLDDALSDASEALDFAFEDWQGEWPVARSLDLLRSDPEFVLRSRDAVVAAIRAPARLKAA